MGLFPFPGSVELAKPARTRFWVATAGVSAGIAAQIAIGSAIGPVSGPPVALTGCGTGRKPVVLTMGGMAPAPQFHVPSGHAGAVRRPLQVAGIAAACALGAFVATVIATAGGPEHPASVDRVVLPPVAQLSGVDAPSSALLDGDAFASAIDAVIAALPPPRSALLDGDAFALAVAEALDAATG